MKDKIRQRALDLGFDACRFTTASPPDHASEFQRWLAEQQHGEMAYLERNVQKRIAPHQVLGGAKTIITLAASYSEPTTDPASPVPDRASRSPERRGAPLPDVRPRCRPG